MHVFVVVWSQACVGAREEDEGGRSPKNFWDFIRSPKTSGAVLRPKNFRIRSRGASLSRPPCSNIVKSRIVLSLMLLLSWMA